MQPNTTVVDNSGGGRGKLLRMTLCAIWLHQGAVALASDSRLPGEGLARLDTCIKVVRVPVRWHLATREGEGQPEFSGETHLGIAFAGSFITAYTVKEAFGELFRRFQVVPQAIRPSMDVAVEFITELYTHITREICSAVLEDKTAGLFVAGYCPEQRRVRAFSLTFQEFSYPLSPTIVELTVTPSPKFIGSGSPLATKLMSVEGADVLKVMRTIIRDDDVKDVGGPLQYGKFSGDDFHVYGVEDYELVDDKKLKVRMLYRGIDLSVVTRAIGESGAHPAARFICPFASDINNLLDQGYEIVPPEADVSGLTPS